MRLRTHFVQLLRASSAQRGVDSTPSEQCAAAAEAVGAHAAGLVMSQRLVRMPVGASGPEAKVAEQVQASLGDGPCLAAEAAGTPMAFTQAQLHERWPMYCREVEARTSLRSTLSFPLRARGSAFAALNFYSNQPSWSPAEQSGVIQEDIADLVGMLLLFDTRMGEILPDTWELAQSQRRRRVWIAIGMVGEAAGIGDADAIAVLRGRAFADHMLLDELAARLVDGSMTTDEILQSPG